ncbi:MAG: hypothetical protein IJS10_00550, partial [Alphaproteobacteria bacterium]|nr:hypothetical protein [Alphaproteobacteria bacterium]
YKVFDNRYVTLNQDMSINTKIKGTDPIYLYINDGSEEQDREYLKSRQNVVAVLELIDDMPVLQGIISTVIKETKFKKPENCYIAPFLAKIHYKRWYDRDTKYKAELIKNFEKGFIKYANTIKPGEETTRNRLKSRLSQIANEQSCADTIDLILEILQTEAFGAIIPNVRRKISEREAVLYYTKNILGRHNILLIDKTHETTIESIYAACIVKHGLNKEPDLQTKYPDVIITSLDSEEQNNAIKNDTRIEEEFVIHDFDFGVPYRLLGVVTKDLTTGKIYTEVIKKYGRAKRLDEDVQNAQTFRNDPNKLRLLCVYLKGYPVPELPEG